MPSFLRRAAVVLLVLSAAAPAQLVISSLSPSSATAGGSAFTLTVNGSGYTVGNIVQWDGVNQTTTFVSATQLHATIGAALISDGGTHNVRVKQNVFFGPFSNVVVFTTNNPAPTFTGLAPGSTPAGGGPVTLSVGGTGFVPSSVVRFAGLDLPTTFNSATSLSATADASLLVVGGFFPITVFNPTPAGGTAGSFTFLVTNPVPAAASISPAGVGAGGPAFTLTVTGSGFNPASVVRVDGAAVATTFVSATQVQGAISAATIAGTGSHAITVVNPTPGGGTSASLTLNVNFPPPALATLAPAIATAGAGPVTLTLTGTGFFPATTCTAGGSVLTPTFVSPTQLSLTVPASITNTPGSVSIAAVNPAPGGGTSNALPLQMQSAAPSIASLSPASVAAGGATFTLVVAGTNFNAQRSVRLNGVPAVTTFTSGTQLQANVPAATIALGGIIDVTVFNAAGPGPGGTSAPSPLSVANPAPVMSFTSPTGIPALSSTFTLTVNGSSFVPASVVNMDGAPLATTFSTSTQLSATVPASAVALGGTHLITVTTPAPGGGTSGSFLFTVNNPVPVLGGLSPTSVAAGTVGLVVTVTGLSFVSTATVRIDGIAIPTTYGGPTSVQGLVPAATIASGGTHLINVLNPPFGGGLSGGAILTVTNPVPAVTALTPASVFAGSGAATITIDGTGFVPTSSVTVNGASASTTFVSPTQLTAIVPASSTQFPGSRAIAVGNASPGGGFSAAATLSVTNATPTVSAISPATVEVGSAGFTLTVSGTGFNGASAVLVDGFTVGASTFVDATQMTTAIPASVATSVGAHAISVVNPVSPGPGGLSGSLPLSVVNPTPLVVSLTPSVVPGGGPDATIVVNGSGFVTSTFVVVDGEPLPTTFVAPTQLTAVLPGTLRRTTRGLTLSAITPTPGGGTTATALTIDGPYVAAVAPSFVPVLAPGAAPLALTVTGSNFGALDVVRANGAALPTTFVNATTLTCVVDATLPATLAPGGFGLTVVRQGPTEFVCSNTADVGVGAAGFPDNRGAVTIAPKPASPGEGFNLRVEAPVENVPFTLIIDFAPPPPFVINFAPGFDLAVGAFFGAPFALVDGLGLFGPATGASLSHWQPTTPAPATPQGLFELRGLVAPPAALGLNMALQAIYIDPSSPIFIGATTVNAPQTL